jgi:hypothetical protein
MDMILTNSFDQINLISYTLTLVSNSGIHDLFVRCSR